MVAAKVEEEQQQQLSNSTMNNNKAKRCFVKRTRFFAGHSFCRWFFNKKKLMKKNNNNNNNKKKKSVVSFPAEITDDVLSRLPVKSILQYRSVSKQWLSRISEPSFTKLHFTRSTNRFALFLSAYDFNTRKRYFFTGPKDGGLLTHLKTLDGVAYPEDFLVTIHSKGLVLFICFCSINHYQYVINPATRKVFKLPDCSSDKNKLIGYLFGFDESAEEHKVLCVSHGEADTTLDIMIFSLSSYLWRKISVELPAGVTCDSLHRGFKGAVCIDNVVHIMAHGPRVLAFDLRTERFSVITTPGIMTEYVVVNKPYIINVNGLLGVVCDGGFETNSLNIWLLQDYENRVWVRETVKFSFDWLGSGLPLPFDSGNMDEIIFNSIQVRGDRVISVPVHNKKTRRFRYLKFTLGHQFQHLEAVRSDLIRCYVESIQPI